MEDIILVLVENLILAIQTYNERLLYRSPQDPQMDMDRGAINALVKVLSQLGYPPKWGKGSVWSTGKSRSEEGFGYLYFPKNSKEFDEMRIHKICGFERGIYWFVDGRGAIVRYNRRSN